MTKVETSSRDAVVDRSSFDACFFSRFIARFNEELKSFWENQAKKNTEPSFDAAPSV